jgi:tetratricopeptide (TPR) repeat protein
MCYYSRGQNGGSSIERFLPDRTGTCACLPDIVTLSEEKASPCARETAGEKFRPEVRMIWRALHLVDTDLVNASVRDVLIQSVFAFESGAPTQMLRLAFIAGRIAEERDDQPGVGASLIHLGAAAYQLDGLRAAKAAFENASSVFRRDPALDQQLNQGIALLSLGLCHELLEGQYYPEAMACFSNAAEVLEQVRANLAISGQVCRSRQVQGLVGQLIGRMQARGVRFGMCTGFAGLLRECRVPRVGRRSEPHPRGRGTLSAPDGCPAQRRKALSDCSPGEARLWRISPYEGQPSDDAARPGCEALGGLADSQAVLRCWGEHLSPLCIGKTSTPAR